MRINHLRQADLNLLIVFTILAEERNVTRAAKRLLLSQPAVSRALQRLRDMFRDDLLIRTSAGYEPTPKGQRLLHELELIKPGIEREEDDAAPFPILLAGLQKFAKRDSAPDQPVPAHRLAAEPQRVARVSASHVRSERTPRSRGIVGVPECIASIVAGFVRVFDQRGSIWPASHHLGS